MEVNERKFELKSNQIGKSTEILVSAALTLTTESVKRRWNEEQRQCRTVRNYNRNDCQHLCEETLISSICSCVPWFKRGKNSTKICNGIDLNCWNLAKNAVEISWKNFTLAKAILTQVDLKVKDDFDDEICNCPPKCDNEVIYKVESVTEAASPSCIALDENVSTVKSRFNEWLPSAIFHSLN